MEVKLERFKFLTDNYNDILIKLLDFSYNKNLLPFRISISISYLKNYIVNNKT